VLTFPRHNCLFKINVKYNNTCYLENLLHRTDAVEIEKDSFYRVTLWASAVFTVARCPSVCLSIILVDCIHTAEDIIKLLVWPASPITLVVWPTAPVPSSKGNPFSWGAKYTGWENFEIFNWNCRLSRKRYEIGPWLLWNVNRKS